MFFIFLGHLIAEYRYIVLIASALLGGPVVSLFAGSLIRFGYLSLIPAYIALMLGELIGDVLWYWIGYHSGERFVERWGKYIGISKMHIAVIKRLFHTHTNTILFFSKITMGFGLSIVTVFTAGLARVSFWKYLAVNMIGQLIWSGILLALGFLLGYSFLHNANIFLRSGLVILYVSIFLLVIIFDQHIRNWFLK